MITTAPSTAPATLAATIDGPPLLHLLVDRFDLDADAAERAAAALGTALHHTWRVSAYGEPYDTWIARMPEPLLTALVDMTARAELDEFGVGHELRIARLMFTELAVEIGNR